MTDVELRYRDATELAELVSTGQVSAVDVVDPLREAWPAPTERSALSGPRPGA
jgi:hypothetical protein